MVYQRPETAIHGHSVSTCLHFYALSCQLQCALIARFLPTAQWSVGIDSLFMDMSDTMHNSPSPCPDDKSIASDGRGVQDALPRHDPGEVKRIWRKVDLHIMPIAVFLYMSSQIDRFVLFL
jgi:hypothetical protein